MNGAAGSQDVEGTGGLHRDTGTRTPWRFPDDVVAFTMSPFRTPLTDFLAIRGPTGKRNRFTFIFPCGSRPVALISSTGRLLPSCIGAFRARTASTERAFGRSNVVRLNFPRSSERPETGRTALPAPDRS